MCRLLSTFWRSYVVNPPRLVVELPDGETHSGVTYMPTRVVAEDRHAVADLVHRVEEVGDEQDRDAVAPELAHDAEQLVGLVGREARGRLVEHEDLRRRDDEARAMAAICWIAIEYEPSVRVTSMMSRPPRISRPGGSSSASRSAPLHRLTADQEVLRHREVGAEVHLLVHGADAQRLCVEGDRMATSTPSREIVPLSGRSAPVSTRTSVDLPAPFSPTSAWISPRARLKLTLSSACTPGNDLSMLSITTMSVAGPVISSLCPVP
jgi:hypothetical protein